MRAIHITGKHNIDKMNKLDDNNYKSIRKRMLEVDEEIIVNHTKQMDIIREMCLAEPVVLAEPVLQEKIPNIQSLFKSELVYKIQGYKGQDIKKNIHQPDTLINLENVMEKLVASKLRCVYCSKPVFILYKNVREPIQWTLDRVDNDLGHTYENTCIACLKCNLQRRLIDNDKFTFTKKLKLKKL